MRSTGAWQLEAFANVPLPGCSHSRCSAGLRAIESSPLQKTALRSPRRRLSLPCAAPPIRLPPQLDLFVVFLLSSRAISDCRSRICARMSSFDLR